MKKTPEKSKTLGLLGTLSIFASFITPVIFIATLALYFEIQNEFTKLNSTINVLNETLDTKFSTANQKLEVLNKVKIAGQNDLSLEKIEQLNAKADKYHIIYLTKEIATAIDNTADFSIKLAELKKVLSDKFPEETSALQAAQKMSIMSFDDIANVVKDSTIPTEAPAKDKSIGDQVKGMFRVTTKDDMRVKSNPEMIAKIIDSLKQKDEWEALKALEQIDKKNEQLKKVVENLNTRNDLKFYLKTIADGVLNND